MTLQELVNKLNLNESNITAWETILQLNSTYNNLEQRKIAIISKLFLLPKLTGIKIQQLAEYITKEKCTIELNTATILIKFYDNNTLAFDFTQFKNILRDVLPSHLKICISCNPIEIQLRKLPNGVEDKVYEKDGELFFEKNVEEYTITNDILMYSGYNVDYAYIKPPTNMINIKNDTVGTILHKYAEIKVTTYNNVINIGKCFVFKSSDTNARIGFIFAKGTTIDQAKAALTGTKLIYQLAMPTITKLQKPKFSKTF